MNGSRWPNPHDMMDLKGEVEQRCLAPPGHVKRFLRQLKPRRIGQHFKENRVKKAANEGPRGCLDLSGTLPRAKVGCVHFVSCTTKGRRPGASAARSRVSAA